MSPAAMAALYARAFPAGRPWREGEIAALTDASGGFALTEPDGFVLGRALAGEAELLTLAVEPARHRHGTGRRLLARFEAEAARRGADRAFLEVAADNTAARALYRAAGWGETGRRRGYYARPAGAVDALVLRKALAWPEPGGFVPT